MSYKKIKPYLTTFINLAETCGLFTSDFEENGPYHEGCVSKSKKKEEVGYCSPGDCPLAYEADIDALKNHDMDLYLEYKDEPESLDGTWLIVYRELPGK